MKWGTIIIIVLLILFIKFNYPDQYDDGREIITDTWDSFRNDTIDNENYNCIEDTSCEYCNVSSGECIENA